MNSLKNKSEEQWFPQIPKKYLGQIGYTAPGAGGLIDGATKTPQGGGAGGHQPPSGAQKSDNAAQSIVRKISYNAAFERF